MGLDDNRKSRVEQHTLRDESTGKELTQESLLSNYKKKNGMMYFHKMIIKVLSHPRTATFG